MLQTLQEFRFPQDLIDILVVSFIIYRVLIIIKGTRALRMAVGIAMLLVVLVASKELGLYTLDWIVTSFWSQIVLALIILFAPEIRRALAQFGRNPFTRMMSVAAESKSIDEVVRAATAMSSQRVGGIIVIERETDLADIVEVGTQLDAVVSRNTLLAIFNTQSPIHDGAVIIHQGRILAAGCFLPIALHVQDPSLGTRHRAAVGLTEETDAVAVVVSEETGRVGLAVGGQLTMGLEGPQLRNELAARFAGADQGAAPWLPWLRAGRARPEGK
ncbi:MAG: TIGR00159 family protein [Nitrospirae bacterium]|nr:TIGR00159 family protein [Nitrospirota bacterium]